MVEYLEISVGDTVRVQIFEYVNNLSNVEDLDLISKFIDVKLNEINKLPTLTELLNEVEVGLILEGVFERHDTRMLTIGQQLLLHHCLILFLLPL
jgi:hypothetical protein